MTAFLLPTASSSRPSHQLNALTDRFDSHGGGWGYSGHSVEAIRFMSDTDILLGGFGLFGGRGEYVGKIKLFDIGVDGGDQVSSKSDIVRSIIETFLRSWGLLLKTVRICKLWICIMAKFDHEYPHKLGKICKYDILQR